MLIEFVYLMFLIQKFQSQIQVILVSLCTKVSNMQNRLANRTLCIWPTLYYVGLCV